MFIAHLPAGYLFTKKLQQKFKKSQGLFLGMLASILPDLDLFYFYLIDNCQHHHHTYWVHMPFYWFLISALLALGIFLFRHQKTSWFYFSIFLGNVFLHLILDTVVGDILWLYPYSETMIHFFTVSPQYKFWVLNFVLHWSFLFEIGILVAAVSKFYQMRICPTST